MGWGLRICRRPVSAAIGFCDPPVPCLVLIYTGFSFQEGLLSSVWSHRPSRRTCGGTPDGERWSLKVVLSESTVRNGEGHRRPPTLRTIFQREPHDLRRRLLRTRHALEPLAWHWSHWPGFTSGSTTPHWQARGALLASASGGWDSNQGYAIAGYLTRTWKPSTGVPRS